MRINTIASGQAPHSVLGLRLEKYDAQGNRLDPIAVEVLYRGGQIDDGDEVEVSGYWKDGTLQASSITSLTTKSQVKGVNRRGYLIGLSVFGALFVAGIVVTILVVLLGAHHKTKADPTSETTVPLLTAPSTLPAGFGSLPGFGTTPPKMVTVPSLKGYDNVQGFSALATLGLSPMVVFVRSASVPFSGCVRTNPPAGTSVATGSSVTIYVSDGASG